MAWTTPSTVTAGNVASAAWANEQVRDNMTYVHSGKPATAITLTSGDITLGGSFADLDATNLSITLSLTTGRVVIIVTATAEAAGGTNKACLDVTIDTTRQGGTDGLCAANCAISVPTPLSFTFLKTGLSVGSHTFRLQGYAAASCVIRAAADSPLHFAVYEL